MVGATKRAAQTPDEPGHKRTRHGDAGQALAPPMPRVPLAIAPATPVPDQLALDDVVAARRAEILAVQRAIAQAREASNTRAWQLLPRHARRRAASHNLLRLPTRLRAKARSELRASNTTAKRRSELRHRMPDRTLRGYLRRRVQLAGRAARPGRRWLETHLWHAKRFRMSGDKAASDGGTGRWGFSLAETPHFKSHRASWRSAQTGVTLHDASYTSAWRLETQAPSGGASATASLQLLVHCFGAAHGWEQEWTAGARICRTVLYERPLADAHRRPASLALAAVAPVEVLWLPAAGPGAAERMCYILVHPAAAPDVDRLLAHALDTLRAAPMRSDPPVTVFPHDFDPAVRFDVQRVAMTPSPLIAAGLTAGIPQRQSNKPSQVMQAPPPARAPQGWNMFDLVGPDAGRLLGAVLRPVSKGAGGKDAPDMAGVELFRQGVVAMEPSAFAQQQPGTVMAFSVYDPRLSFPPKYTQRPAAAQGAAGPATEQAQAAALSPGGLAGAEPSHAAAANNAPARGTPNFFAYHAPPTYTQGMIHSRRAKVRLLLVSCSANIQMLVPGARLKPTEQDDRVPVVVIQRTVGDPTYRKQLFGYTLLVPRGWGQAFWLSLVHPGTKVLGQAQVRQQHLNAGLLSFPQDWPGAAAYVALETESAAQRRDAWERRPPAKRVNFDAARRPHPFGGMPLWALVCENAAALGGVPDMHISDTQPWTLVAPPDALSRLGGSPEQFAAAPPTRPARHTPASLWARRLYHDGVLSAEVGPGALLPSISVLHTAVVPVRLVACRRGAFHELATVHLIPTFDAHVHWRQLLDAPSSQKQKSRMALEALEQGSEPAPGSAIGVVTTGDYALAQGSGQALASIALRAWLELERREALLRSDKPRWGRRKRNVVPLAHMVLVRNVSGPLRAASASLATA